MGTVAVLKIMEKPYDSVFDYLKKFNVDINPVKMGIDEDLFVFCMQNATEMRKNRYTYLHEADLNVEKLKKIYKEIVRES